MEPTFKTSPLSHIELERHRFAHYQPQGVECMTLTRDRSLLAVARENKSIEIWTVPNSWSQLLLIPGHQSCDIRNIHWLEPAATTKQGEESNPLYYKTTGPRGVEHYKKRRLITTGLNGLVIEWNL
jgi:hypothetical protein